MSQRALITGISGFVGGFLAEHLLDSGDAVLGVSPDGRWMASSPAALASCVEVLPWDVADRSAPDDEARRRIEDFRPTAIYHLAALSVPADCGCDEPSPAAAAVNVEGARRVVALAESLSDGSRSRGPRLLFTGSSHVYAPVSAASPTVDETAPLEPASGYGLTKLAAERIVLQAARTGRCEAVVARAFQHAGPRQSDRMMLPQWARQLAADSAVGESEPVEVHTLDAYIDLSDVRDVVRAYRLLVERGENGSVYNVGSGVSRRSGDILNALMRIAGSRRPVIELRPGRKQDPIADTARLRAATAWRPEIPIERTVADTLQYWRQRMLRLDAP